MKNHPTSNASVGIVSAYDRQLNSMVQTNEDTIDAEEGKFVTVAR